MSGIELRQAAKKALRDASRTKIGDWFVALPHQVRGQRWIQTTNRYRERCTQLYRTDLKAHTVNDPHLIGYIASSAPTHAIDGWSFLGRAVESLLRGDSASAIHFGYYAELRAAMSLMACEAVGIFNNKHPVVDGTGITQPLPTVHNGTRFIDAGTHAIVWPCVIHWASLRKAGSLIDEIIRPSGIAISDWVRNLNGNVPARAIAQVWLKSWGVDLSIYDDDHNFRNEVSYRPSELKRPTRLPADDAVEFVQSLWELFEPSPDPAFPTIELHLLGRALLKAGIAIPDAATLQASCGLQQAEANVWANQLAARVDPLILTEAETFSKVQDPRCHLQVIARASLLLYFSTMSCRRHLRQSGIGRTQLRHWWEETGSSRGLWPTAGAPNNPIDIWADVLDRIADLRAWRAALPAAPGFHALRSTQSQTLDLLGVCELIGMWGLAS